MLSLIDVRKEYGEGESTVTALRGVSVSFRENEFVAILGPSGCGKTTLLNIIGGLDHYTSGDLVIRGVSTKLYRDADWDVYRNHSVGFVFQSYNLIPHQSVLSNVELALTLSGVPKSERRQRATDALVRVGLGDQLKKRPNQLSGGQMQRVAIARALVNNPDILLADEPTGALDTETSIQVMDLLREVAREKLVVMVTHNPDLADRYATRTIRLLDGEVVGDTAPFIPDEQPAPEPVSASLIEEPGDKDGTPTSEKKKAKKDKKPKKRSMSLRTALSLSLNNLMTKKGRTFLTSFAGSIGIIGIALILALSNGINLYIRHIQEDALSSYPITINREETDLVSMISSLGEQRKEGRDHPTDDGNIYSSPVFYNLINTLLAPDRSENNLTAFKAYIDGGAFKNVNATIQYGYDIPLTVYTQDPETGEYVSSDVNALINGIGGGVSGITDETSGQIGGAFSFSSSFSAYSVWSEVLGGKEGELVADLVKEQYDVIAGEWPKGAGDVLLVVSDNDEVNDLTLYALGLKSESEMREMMIAAFTGTKIEQHETEKWSYEEILGRTFRTIAPARLYQKVGEKFQNVSNQKAVLETMLSSDEMSIGLRICGILRKNPDATSTSATGTLLYTSELTKYLIESTKSSQIVKEQLENPDVDVLTGLPFKVDPETKPKNDAEKVTRLTEYVSGLSPAGKAELLKTMLTTHYDHQLDLTGDPDDNSVKHVTVRITDAVDQMMTVIGTNREQITAWVNAYYPEYAAFISYFEDESELVTTVQTLLTIKVAQELEAQGEAIYESYRNTPSEPEIAAGAARILATLPDRETKKNYVVETYKKTTEISEGALTAWAEGLSDDELDGVTEKLARDSAKAAIAADPTVDEATKDARCAAVLDGIVGAFNETEKASAYEYFVPDGSANSTYEETLARLYVYDEDTPSRISIYVTTFAEKDKVTAIIAEYNKGVKEEDQITYTDIMALLMTSITYILNAVTYVLVAFVSVSLVVSSIMIGIITYISVLERTKEIGILRAIGASKRDVSRVFNAETLIIGFSAGVIGIVVTLLFCIPINLILRALTGIGNIAAVLPVGGAVALVLISMGLTLLAGLIPSRVAAKKDPVVALRTE